MWNHPSDTKTLIIGVIASLVAIGLIRLGKVIYAHGWSKLQQHFFLRDIIFVTFPAIAGGILWRPHLSANILWSYCLLTSGIFSILTIPVVIINNFCLWKKTVVISHKNIN